MSIVNQLDIETLTLATGKHSPGQQMCVMEAAAYIAGEPWSDHPACASEVIGTFLRSWNDTLPDDDRQSLRRYAVDVIGTKTTPEVESELAWMVSDWLVRVQTPAWLRLAGLTDQADRLAGLAELSPETVSSVMPVLDAVRSDADAAWDAARAAAGAAVWAAAGDAAWAAAGAAVWAAAWDAVWAAVGAAAGDAARAVLRPTVVELQESARDLVDRMIVHAKAAA